MIDPADRKAWADLVARLDEPSALEVADTVAGNYEIGENRAYEIVENALDGGVLTETDTGAFGSVEVAESKDEMGGSPDATPGAGKPH